jgi:hypothetical protein
MPIERKRCLDVSPVLDQIFVGGFVRANDTFKGLDKGFWAHVRSLSEALGYTVRGKGTIKVHGLADIKKGMKKLKLLDDHLVQSGKPTELAQQLIDYFEFRADILNNTVQNQLMDKVAAQAMYERLLGAQEYKLAAAMNKQSGDKKKVAYLTAMVNMLIEANCQGIEFDHNPQQLTTVTRDGMPLRTLARRIDGAFPSAVNPVAVWEIKEYYHTTTFGSRVADGVYETLLDGMELEEMRVETGVEVEHILIADAHYTWWVKGRSYLCRMIDMLHMGYVDEILFGTEIEDRLPAMVAEWAGKTRDRQAVAEVVLEDDTALL